MRGSRFLLATAAFGLLLLPACPAHGQQPVPAEYGDAPDGALAYPGSLVIGKFPTCLQGATGFVKHTNNVPVLYWGQSVDFEIDGNAGTCTWPPYNSDECGGPFDIDAGLIRPDGFTISGGVATSCAAPASARSLGTTCGTAQWGANQNIDLTLTNNTGSAAWVNIIIDWNQDGRWGGVSACAGGSAREWVVQNLAVPAGFTGSLSALLPPTFLIGPNPGYVWARFTVHDGPPILTLDWDGSGLFDSGETEDYMLRVDGNAFGEYGDAPNGVLAYPPAGTVGQFPTCTAGTSFVFHGLAGGGTLYLGPSLDTETDGNHGNCAFTPYDNDECGPGDGDAGLLLPGAYTIDATGNYALCPNSTTGTLGEACTAAVWGANLDITAVNSRPSVAYLHVLADWGQDGAWDSNTTTCGAGPSTVSEHVILNFAIPSGFSGPVSTLSPPSFQLGKDGYVWFRFTISDTQVPANWDGSGSFADGETEDYLLNVAPLNTGVSPHGPIAGFALERADPNPFGSATVITYSIGKPAPLRVWVADLAGRRIASLFDGQVSAGRNALRWDGRRDDGRAAGPGIYYVHAVSGSDSRALKLVRVR